MWSKRDRERELRALLAAIEAADEPRRSLVAKILREACPRLQSSIHSNEVADRLFAAHAWLDLGVWLIGWELPDWSLHRLSCDDRRWSCMITLRGLALNWAEDVVEYQHDNLVLALFGALVEAQRLRINEPASSNVVSFRTARTNGHMPGGSRSRSDE
ncbi:hypothetical protein [Microvirga sp. M2]|uniref:hypothetical protein n=1 Tax=Microvirga sp. M2 TaxID=3073270 RepID=UPI0039C40900